MYEHFVGQNECHKKTHTQISVYMKYLEGSTIQPACFPECGLCPYLALGPKCSELDSVFITLHLNYAFTLIWLVKKLRLSNLIPNSQETLCLSALRSARPPDELHLPLPRLLCPLETQLWRGEVPAWQRSLVKGLAELQGETKSFRLALYLVVEILPLYIRPCIQSPGLQNK